MLNGLIGEDNGPVSQQTLNPVTLQVSGYDRNAHPMCVFLIKRPTVTHFPFFPSSTKRSPFSVTATQPLRIPMPSSHADVSGPRLQPVSGRASARDEESGGQHEAQQEGYETALV